ILFNITVCGSLYLGKSRNYNGVDVQRSTRFVQTWGRVARADRDLNPHTARGNRRPSAVRPLCATLHSKPQGPRWHGRRVFQEFPKLYIPSRRPDFSGLARRSFLRSMARRSTIHGIPQSPRKIFARCPVGCCPARAARQYGLRRRTETRCHLFVTRPSITAV